MKQVMAIAGAERRTTGRLARYWVFLGLAYIITSIVYAQYSYTHGMYSSYSGTIGDLSPRFFMSRIGLYYSVIFLLGSIFLAFDLRERDKRDRIADVLDSKPYTNLELVTGRFLGIFISTWVPIAVLAIIFELAGLILSGLNSPFGEPIEYSSLFSFVFISIIPALSFAIALVFFITLLVRSRLATTIILIVLMGISEWTIIKLPLHYGVLCDIISIRGLKVSSEIITRIATPEDLLQRLSVLFAAFALLGFCAAVHPRLDGGSRPRLAFGSVILMIFAFSLAGVVYYKNTGDIRIRETWKKAHEALYDKPVPDIIKISGNIKISPGEELLLDLDITFSASDKRPLKEVLFTLNPGEEVKSVSDATGKSIPFSHENGLLQLSLPRALQPGEKTTVHLATQGLPDNRFAFLYSSANLRTLKFIQEDIFLLGDAPGLFDKAFVALMPGLRCPAAG